MVILNLLLTATFPKKIAQFSMPKRFGPEKCPMYLRVPWIGKASIGLDKNVKTAVESCYGSITTRVVFTLKRMLPVARKDFLPTTLKSSIVYEYSCHCDSRYIGQTSQRLQDRIKQHVPKWLQQQVKRPTLSQPGRSSSSSSFEGYPLQARNKQDWGRGFILLLPQTAALPGSNAGSDVIKPASSFIIQNRQTLCSMWCPMYRACC